MKKKRKGRPRKEQINYCVEILEHDVSYLFSLALNDKYFPGPYWEHASIDITGKFLYPKTLADRIVEITILGSRDEIHALMSPETYRQEPKAVGGFNLRGKVSSFIGSIPFDALPLVTSLLHNRSIKYMTFSGEKLYRGNASVRSMHFEKEYEREDFERSG